MCLPFFTTTDDIDCVQVSELAEEQELRDLFERFGRVTRVFLARDRETQRAKGFAFISFADRDDAARACEKMDDCRFSHVTVNMAGSNWNSRLSPLDSPRGIRQAYLECFLFGLTTIGRKNGQGETASLRVYALLIMIDPVSMLPVRMIKALFCHNEYSPLSNCPRSSGHSSLAESDIPGISRELTVTHGNGPAQCTRRRKASWGGDCNLFSFQLIPHTQTHASHSWSTRDDIQRFIGNAQPTGIGDAWPRLHCRFAVSTVWMVWMVGQYGSITKYEAVRTVYETKPKEASLGSETVSPDSKVWSHPDSQPIILCKCTWNQ